jgi:hypothetical protein
MFARDDRSLKNTASSAKSLREATLKRPYSRCSTISCMRETGVSGGCTMSIVVRLMADVENGQTWGVKLVMAAKGLWPMVGG